MEILNKFGKYLTIIGGVTLIVYTSLKLGKYYYIKKIMSDFNRNLYLIRDTVISKYKRNHKIEKFIPKSITQIEEENIKFSIIMIDKIDKKPTFGVMKTDPFAAPYDPDFYICDITNYHTLLINKFSLVDYHVLITSKDFVSQNDPISYKDFYAALKVMKALNAFCFFNSGPKAGASQQHFHLQVIPYSSLLVGRNLPINKVVSAKILSLKNSKEDTIFQVIPFKFLHLFYYFQENILEGINDENIQSKSQKLESGYLELIKNLRNKKDFEDYNMILTSEWMLIVPRSKEKALDLFSLNAVAFAGSFVVKDEIQLNEVNKYKPLHILKSVGFPD